MKRAIVIGATSGIGKGMAQLLTKNEYIVGITGRRINLLNDLKKENPNQYIIKSFDVTDIDNVTLILNDLVEELGGLDLMIISAGTGPYNYNLEFELEKLTIDTDVIGFTAIADWTYKYFKLQNYGHLVAITSIAGLEEIEFLLPIPVQKHFKLNIWKGYGKKQRKKKI